MAWDAASRGHYPLASGRPSTSAGTHSLLRRLTALAKRGRPHSTGDIRRSAVFAAADVEPAVVVNNPPYDYRRPYTSVFPSTTIDATDEGSSTMMAADAAAYGITTTTTTTSKPPTSNYFVSTSSRDSKGKLAELTTAPLRVQVEVRFPGLRSNSSSLTSGVPTYTHEYASSQTFVPSDRLCNGLLRRLTHCSTELITRKDSDALQQQQPQQPQQQQQQQQPPDRPRFVKPLKYELHFRIVRRDTAGGGGSAWAERTFCSYQKQALTAHDAREIVLATHRMVGLFLRRHDPSFRWMDVPAAAFPAALSRSHTDTTPALVRPVVDEPLPLCCVPRSRFLDASQSYEFIPGYAIHLSFHSRSRSRSRQQYDWKCSVRLPSRQTAPLSLALAEDLLWRTFDSLHQALTERRTAFFDEHKACNRLEGIDGSQPFDDDALGIELRIQNHLGPDYSHLHRAIRSKLNLFPHPDALDCQQFLQDVHDNFVRARDDTDAELARLPDFDLRVVTLRGPGWSVEQPARFVLDSSASHSRRSIEAILDRVQTGIADVLRGSNASIHILAYKRGQLVLDTTMLAHRDLANPPPSTNLTADEQQASALVSQLKTRIQRDLDMVCKDTCSLDDASDDRSVGAAPTDAAENKTVTPQSPLVEAATAPVADDEPNTPAPRVVELPGDVVFEGLPPDSLPSTPTSSRRAFPLIPERFNLSSSRSSSVASVPALPKEEAPSNASLDTTLAIPETSALETSEQGPSTQCEEPSVEALPGAEPATEMQPDEHQPAESKSEPERVPTEMSATDSAQELRSELELRPASPVPPCELDSGTENAPQPGLIPEPQPMVALETLLEEILENATVPESEPEPEAGPEVQLQVELKGQTEMEPESQSGQEPTADNDVELMPPPPDDREVELGEMEEGLFSVAAPDEPILPPWPTVSEGTEDDAVSQAQIILADAIATAVAEAIAEPIFDDEDLVISSSPLARGQNLFPTADHTLLSTASTNTTRPSTPSLSVSSGEVNSPRISLLETPEAAHEARADVLTRSDSETDDLVYRRGYGADNEPNPDGGCFSSFAPSTKSASTVRKLTFPGPLSVPFPLQSENGSTIGGLSPTEIMPEITDTPISEEHLEQPTEVVVELDSVPSGEPLMHFDDFAATKPTLNLEDDADIAVNDSTISVGLSPATGKDVALENSQLKDSGYGGEELSFSAPAERKASEDTTPAFERLRISSHDKAGPTLSDLLADSEFNSESESLQIMLPEYAPSPEEQKLEPILEVLDEEETTLQQFAPDQEFTEPEQAAVQTPDSETEADEVFARSEEPNLETIHESAFAPLDESGETIDPVPQDPDLHPADAELGQHSQRPTVPEYGPIPEPEIPEAPAEVEIRPKPDFIGRELELVNRKLELVDTEIDLIDTELELVDTELDFVNSELELAYAESEPAEELIPQQPDLELKDSAKPSNAPQDNVDMVLSELQPPSDSEEDKNAANPPDDLPSTAQPTASEEVHLMDDSVHEPLLEIQPELAGQSETSILPECEGFENPLALEMADTREPSTPLPLIPTEEVDGPHPASNAEKNIDLLKTQQIGPRVVVSVRQTVTDFARSLIPRFCEAMKPTILPLKDTVPTSTSALSPFSKATADDSSGPDDSDESSAEESSRGSVDTFRSFADEEPAADEHPHLSSLPTAGYFGLRETKLVEVGLRGALTGSHAFDNVSGISR